jgi:prepilin-type N-terminal cleavage/methylation domain-containing protein
MKRIGQLRFTTQRGFTLVELTIVMAVLGILAMTALTLYANLQGRARVAKAQADLKGLHWALVAFGAHCGDVPNTATTFTEVAPLALGSAPDTCANAVPAGPFYPAGAILAPATGWTYTYTRIGPGQFTLTASHPSDVTNPITVP